MLKSSFISGNTYRHDVSAVIIETAESLSETIGCIPKIFTLLLKFSPEGADFG